jgi:hypothetical protein
VTKLVLYVKYGGSILTFSPPAEQQYLATIFIIANLLLTFNQKRSALVRALNNTKLLDFSLKAKITFLHVKSSQKMQEMALL